MRPRLFSVYFGGPATQYPRLAAVLRLTAQRHAPDWDIDVERIEPPSFRAASGNESDAANHWKLQHWTRAVMQSPDGARLLLVDADTFVTGALDALWDHAFDVAYTARPEGARYPLNAGVVAVRVSDDSRAFVAEWLAHDALFLKDREAHRAWRKKYGGMNQASLGAVLESGVAARLGLDVAALPCAIWNAEDTAWETVGPETRIVHVKSALRMMVFGMLSQARLRPLARMWKDLDAEAQAAGAAA